MHTSCIIWWHFFFHHTSFETRDGATDYKSTMVYPLAVFVYMSLAEPVCKHQTKPSKYKHTYWKCLCLLCTEGPRALWLAPMATSAVGPMSSLTI